MVRLASQSNINLLINSISSESDITVVKGVNLLTTDKVVAKAANLWLAQILHVVKYHGCRQCQSKSLKREGKEMKIQFFKQILSCLNFFITFSMRLQVKQKHCTIKENII